MKISAPVVLAILVGVVGCGTQTKPIRGTVCTRDAVSQSSWRRYYDEKDIKSTYSPLRDTKVYLAFDEQGIDPVPGCSVTTNPDGSYVIPGQASFPRAKTAYNDYYFIVEKNGYHRFVTVFNPGPYAFFYYKNIVLLKPLSKDE